MVLTWSCSCNSSHAVGGLDAGPGNGLASQFARLDLVVLDELGYLPFARSGGQLLFHLVSKLSRRPR